MLEADTDSFDYLGTTANKTGCAEQDFRTRVGESASRFSQFEPNSKKLAAKKK